MIHLNEKCLFKFYFKTTNNSKKGFLLSFQNKTFTFRDLGNKNIHYLR